MTLLITVFAAIASTIVWYSSEKARELKVGLLVWLFWGASLMWMGDAIFGYIEDGADYFVPSLHDMLNDTFLGISVIALAGIIWMIYVLIKDPKNVLKNRLLENK